MGFLLSGGGVFEARGPEQGVLVRAADVVAWQAPPRGSHGVWGKAAEPARDQGDPVGQPLPSGWEGESSHTLCPAGVTVTPSRSLPGLPTRSHPM